MTDLGGKLSQTCHLFVIVIHMDVGISPFMCDYVTDLSIIVGVLSKVQDVFV